MVRNKQNFFKLFISFGAAQARLSLIISGGANLIIT